MGEERGEKEIEGIRRREERGEKEIGGIRRRREREGGERVTPMHVGSRRRILGPLRFHHPSRHLPDLLIPS